MRTASFLLLSILAAGVVGACTSANGPLTASPNADGAGGGGGGGSGFDDGDCCENGCCDEDDATTGGFEQGPDTSKVVLAKATPRPVTGGAMMIAADGAYVASDSDRDALTWALPDDTATKRLDLAAGDEPGRLVEDGAGLVHVVLRGGGAIATVDRAAGAVVRRTDVCAAPRGVAYDAERDAVIVACAGGELVTLAAADDTVLSTAKLADDLHDVVALGEGFVAVARLRTAELLLVDATGDVVSTSKPAATNGFDPDVAWRAVAVPGHLGAVAMTHELASPADIDLSTPGEYSSGFGSDIVTSALSLFTFDLDHPTDAPVVATNEIDVGPLPVDVTFDAAGRNLAVAFYGASTIATFMMNSDGSLQGPWPSQADDVASVAMASDGFVAGFRAEDGSFRVVNDSAPHVIASSVALTSLADTGRSLFHLASRDSGTIACASCHPEGHDDGRVWSFIPLGKRRTPSLVGGLLATAPFHWDGAFTNIPDLVDEIYTQRMGGMIEDAAHSNAVGRFLDGIPRVPLAAASSDAIDHGKTLFESPDVGCTGCHSGPHLTNNASVDVGTGGVFQIPTLIGVSQRGPWIHNGCATTLADRFDPSCGGGDQHGHTSQLSTSDVADLVSYLETL